MHRIGRLGRWSRFRKNWSLDSRIRASPSSGGSLSRQLSPASRRHRNPSSSPSRRRRRRSSSRSRSPRRSPRRSPSLRRTSRRHSVRRYSRPPGRHSRSGQQSRSPGRRSNSSSQGSRSSSQDSRSSSRESRSPVRHSRSQSRHFPSLNSESSVEHGLHITNDKECYGAEIPEGKKMSDKQSDANRNDLAVGPVFSSHHSHPQGMEQCPSREKDLLGPFSIRNDKDYRCRDISVYDMKCDYLHNQPREDDLDGKPLRRSLDSSDGKGQELKHHQYDLDYRPAQGFLPRTQDYCKQNLARSQSPTYLDEDLRDFEVARRKREEALLSRNMNNPLQSSEPQYLYRLNEAPAKPLKSILKRRMDDPLVQPEVFSNTSASVSEPVPSSKNTDLFSLEMENFIKQFHKNKGRWSAPVKEPQGTGNVPDWHLYSEQQKNAFSSQHNSGSFFTQKEHHERILKPIVQQRDFLLCPEKDTKESSSFSRILGMTADSSNTQEKIMYSLPDIEDEEKFLYGDDETSSIPPCASELTLNSGKGSGNQKVASPLPPSLPTTSDTSEKHSSDYEKIHDLLKTIGLDIGLAEIGKLAARTQERLHGKKPSRSPDRHVGSTHKPASRERCQSQSNTLSPESSRKHSLSPPGSFPPSKDISTLLKTDYDKNKTIMHYDSAGIPEYFVPSAPVVPSAPLPPLDLPPSLGSLSWYNFAQPSPFAAPPLPQNPLSLTMPHPHFGVYEQYVSYAPAGWSMCAPPGGPELSAPQALPPHYIQRNLKPIERVSERQETPKIKQDNPRLVQIPTTVTLQPVLNDGKEKTSEERKRASQKREVIMEKKKLQAEQKRLETQLYYLKKELSRLSRQQVKMLQVKRRKEDLLLLEATFFRRSIAEEVAELEKNANDVQKKICELNKVDLILGMDTVEKSEKNLLKDI